MRNMTPRTVHRIPHATGKQTRHCRIIGCNRHTKNGKPYCVNHVESNPYVSHVLSVISDRKHEEEIVARRGWTAVNIDGSIAQEILQFLRVNGARSLKRLSRDLRRDSKLQAMYCVALTKAGLINVSKNKRGGLILRVA